MSVGSSMTFDTTSLSKEKIYDGDELFDVFQSTNHNSNTLNEASNTSNPPVQFVKTSKTAKRPSAMEFESGEFFPGQDLVGVFEQQPLKDTSTGPTSHQPYRRRSTLSKNERRESMMSLVTHRRESLMSLMSLADCSLVENPSILEDEQDQRESMAAKILSDMNHLPRHVEQVKSNLIDITKSKSDEAVETANADADEKVDVNANADADANANINTNATATADANATNANTNANANANANANTIEETGSSKISLKGNEKVEYIEDIGPYDIICGRNNGSHNWVGNRRFRITIMMNLKRYTDSPSREEKTQVIKSVIETLLNTEEAGARFIKKVGEGMYVRLKDKQIREKVGHAFRDMMSLSEQEGGALEAKCFE